MRLPVIFGLGTARPGRSRSRLCRRSGRGSVVERRRKAEQAKTASEIDMTLAFGCALRRIDSPGGGL